MKAALDDSALPTHAPLLDTSVGSKTRGCYRQQDVLTLPSENKLELSSLKTLPSKSILELASSTNHKSEARDDCIQGQDVGSTVPRTDVSPCNNCEVMHQLIVLYEERQRLAARTLQAQRQIQSDERDVAHLLMTAARYQDSARKRSEMVKEGKRREIETIKLGEHLLHEIAALQNTISRMK